MLIEQAMYFALGFLFAGLMMLLALPAFWRRAMRLSMRRLQLLAPLTREDAIAERDLLRADFAVRERRMEQQAAAVEASKRDMMLDIGRHAGRISELHEALLASQAYGRDLERQLAETRQTLAERNALLAETQETLREARATADRDAMHARLVRDSNEQKIGDLQQQNADSRRDLAQLGEEFFRLLSEADRLTGVEHELKQTIHERDAAHIAKRALDAHLAAARWSADTERERLNREIEHLENALRQTRDEVRVGVDRLDALRADYTMLQGAASVLREEYDALRLRIADAERPLDQTDLARLRGEIAELGARIADDAAVADRADRPRSLASGA